MKQTEHLKNLKQRFQRFQAELKALKDLNVDLEHRPEQGKWNARECLEHLVVMWQTYQEQFDTGIPKSKKRSLNEYSPGWFGKWFATKMKPLEDNSGMKTYKIFEPANYESRSPVVSRLVEVQDEMIAYLQKMESIDINKSRIRSPASRFIRLKMGDAFMILANHQDRHWQQALNAMDS